MDHVIMADDYQEPRCLLNMHPERTAIPVRRVIERLDAYLHQNDYAAAARHLRYWLSEAEACHDMHGKLTVLNEQIGLFRKTDQEAECLSAISQALSLADAMDMAQSVTYATTLINAATGYKAFGKAEKALPLYRRAQAIYEAYPAVQDERLGGLYNNMALTLTALQEYREARALYQKAIGIMEKQPNGSLEAAITHLNLADLEAAEHGLEAGAEEIEHCLQKAEALLLADSLPKDGHYAFVCEKCAPVFGYYGYFLTERELNKRAREIYERA